MIEPTSWICQRESAWQPNNFNYLTVDAPTRHLEPMPACLNPYGGVSSIVGQDVYNAYDLPAAKKGVKTPLPTTNSYRHESQFCLPSGHDWKEIPHEATYALKKKFLIFDRSGEETRMILSTLCPPIRNQTAIGAKPVLTYTFSEKLHKVADLSEDSGENHVLDEGSDYHENTEEINALLYSSDNDTGNDIYGDEDDDVISTGRKPSAMIEYFDEVTSFERPCKRQKLLEDSATQFYEDESVVELNSSNCQEVFRSLSHKRSRMHKIHDTLRTVQKLIPGSKTKDPLSIIDEAISYLKSLKANTLDMEATEGSSSCTPFPF